MKLFSLLKTATTAPDKTRKDTEAPSPYHRYHIEAQDAPNIVQRSSRFRVKVKKRRLFMLLLHEIFRYWGNKKVMFSRPCVYGVFSGRLGGFNPREQLCVGCLRCTTQYPKVVQIHPNPDRLYEGDTFFTPGHVDTVLYEAGTGRPPVRGAGYRGPFGGAGWDGMWTDMSEIVRPTRDGIHGREFISTVVDIGRRPSFLSLDGNGQVMDGVPETITLSIPMLFDAPPRKSESESLWAVLAEAAQESETLAIIPLKAILNHTLSERSIVPLVTPEDRDGLRSLDLSPPMIEVTDWDAALLREIRSRFPGSLLSLRLQISPGLEEELLRLARSGEVDVFHIVGSYHGRGEANESRFILDVIRSVHTTLVGEGIRDEVSLIGSGGIIAAEHVVKAIICGLDAVALDMPVMAALQAELIGDCLDRETSEVRLPDLPPSWGVQRLKNLLASWHDQMLEMLGAMGLREVRRLRGEIGRAMFQKDLEREAFGEIEGYGDT